jgi:hypothetical protein
MENEPELSGKYLGTITRDFVTVSDTLKDASYQIRVRGISEYPIFPISKEDIPLGQLLIGSKDIQIVWNYNVSYIDEFIQRGLIAEDKIDDFKSAYRDPEEYCCLFVVDHGFTNFIFVPYPED